MAQEEIEEVVSGQTVATLFRSTVEARPDAVALRWLANDQLAGGHLTWAGHADQACRAAGGLADLGVEAGDRVILMMGNRPEFHVVDIACVLLGATPVSIYNSSSPEQIAYLAGHADATLAVAGDGEQLDRLLRAWPLLPVRRPLITVDDAAATNGALPYGELLSAPPVDFDAAVERTRPEDLATLIYTSGTTGPPKGVMITHANVAWTLESMRRAAGTTMTGWRQISYLPMAHIAERIVTHYLHLAHGTEVTACPDLGQLPSYLREVRPQFFVGVPRVWEKLYAGIQAALAATPPAADGPDPFSSLRAHVGLDCVELAATTGAPMQPEILEFFQHIGVPLSEVFGMSEGTGPIAWAPHRVKAGSIGPPLPGQELKLLEDGELCYRGGNVFAGYLKDNERTAEVLDADGWVHSGDIGRIDEDGYLSIVGRKKELIITAGGKNVSPANLETTLKASRLIAQACAVGDARPYMTALIVLDPDAATRWAATRGLDHATLAALASNPDLLAEIALDIEAANAAFSHAEQIKRYAVLPEEWRPDSDELTATMKLKRAAILRKYADTIDALYNDDVSRPVG